MTLQEFVSRLDGVRQIEGGYLCRCPSHDDHKPSLSASEGEGGRILAQCHAGCEIGSIVSAMGLAMTDLFPERDRAHHPRPARPPPAPPPPLSDTQVRSWAYALRHDQRAWAHVTDTLGFTEPEITRFCLGLAIHDDGRRWLVYPSRKGGVWTYAKLRSLDGEKTFLRVPHGQESHLFEVDSLEPDGTAIVVEGERDAVAARVLGLHTELGDAAGAAVVSLPNGASRGKPGDTILGPLKTQARVYLATDADAAGDAAAAALMEALGSRARRVRLQRHKDLGDVLSAMGPQDGQAEALLAFREAQDAADDPQGVGKLLRNATKPFTAGELSVEPPPLRFLLYPYLPDRAVSILAGPGGSSKSTLGTYLAVCRGLGRPFFGGREPKPGRTLILSMEDRRDDYLRKLGALRIQLGEEFNAGSVAEAISIADLCGISMRMVEMARGGWQPSVLADHLATFIRRHCPGTDLLVMETVSRLTGGAETNESLGTLVEAGQRLCELAQVAVLLVGHVSQETARNGLVDQNSPRGGSAFGDNARSTMVLMPVSEKNRAQFCKGVDLSEDDMRHTLVFAHVKCNGAPAADPILLERKQTPFGPVLSLASFKKTEDVNPEELPRQITWVVAGLTQRGITVSRRSLRTTYFNRFKCSVRAMLEAIDVAIAQGYLVEKTLPGGGRGSILVPTGAGLSVDQNDGSPVDHGDD